MDCPVFRVHYNATSVSDHVPIRCIDASGALLCFVALFPDILIDTLVKHPFWANLLADRQLAPEIRDGHVTVYFRGGALLKSLRFEGQSLVADVHPKYIPVRASRSSLRLMWRDSGFAFTEQVEAMPFGLGSPDVLAAYKDEMAKVLVKRPEAELVQQIIERVENIILDQEIAFQESGDSRDKIDLCHFDGGFQKLVFVEVKRVDDARLIKPDGRPEVLDQLAAYGQRLDLNRLLVLDAYRTVVACKRRLGLTEWLKSVPPEGADDLLAKPVLVIGNCSSADVKAIKAKKDEWAPLMAGLPSVAAGLILCGKAGCRLALVPGSQTLIF